MLFSGFTFLFPKKMMAKYAHTSHYSVHFIGMNHVGRSLMLLKITS